jgi:hypothetical protein
MHTKNQKGNRMSPDAFAGFLKLWLTPGGRLPEPSPELAEYLRHANRREPLPAQVRSCLGQPADRAA